MSPSYGPSLRLGSRESPLALVQAEFVAGLLRARFPHLAVEIRTFKTQGDRVLDVALSKVGDKGLFVKELETALLAGEIDLAVHSMKDMPSTLPEGLSLVSAGPREDARDVLLDGQGRVLDALPAGAVVGTSSLRREAQLRRLRPDLRFEVIRGNLQTRLRKLEKGQYDAIVLAAAGVHRLGWQDKVSQYFDPWDGVVPAVAQGILAVEYRGDDCRVAELTDGLRLHAVETARLAERAVLAGLEGGCQLPLGAYCRAFEAEYRLRAVVLSPDGAACVQAELRVDDRDPAGSGAALAAELLDLGAGDILQAIRRRQQAPVDSP